MSVCMRRCWVCACVCFCRYVAASIIVFGFSIIGLCVYAFLWHVCDRVTTSVCGWIAGLIAEFICVSACCNCVFSAAGLLVAGWSARVDVLREVSRGVAPKKNS